jgi:hypothetical protein
VPVQPNASGLIRAEQKRPDTKVNADRQADDPKAAFHANNRADWVGQAHNKGLQDIYSQLLSTKAHSNICAEIERLASASERIPDGKEKGTAANRSAVARTGLAATGLCSSSLVLGANRPFTLTNSSRSSTTGVEVDGVSPEAQAVLDQIGNAVQYATSSGTLAANLNSILSQMPALPTAEVDVVNAVASVSQSSYEYWETNTSTLTQQVTTTYGGCLGQYADEATALNNCMGISSGPVEPTRYEKNGSGPNVSLAANFVLRTCYSPSGGDIAEADFVGAGLGAIGGIFGPPGILAGAAVGGLGASSFTGWFKVGRLVYCLSRGGTLSHEQQN